MAAPRLQYVTLEPSDQVEGVVVVTLCRPKVNALNTQLMEELSAALVHLAALPDAKGVLLRSAYAKCFCAGLDLSGMRELAALPDEEAVAKLQHFAFTTLEDVLRSSVTFPKPLAVVVEGHALAGGFIVPLTADYIAVGSQGRGKLGLTELSVGVPLPWMPQAVAEHRLGRQAARKLIFDSLVMGSHRAHSEFGFGDCLDADPTSRAIEWLATAVTRSPLAFSLTKRNYWRPVLAYTEDAEVQRQWSEAVCSHLRSFSKM